MLRTAIPRGAQYNVDGVNTSVAIFNIQTYKPMTDVQCPMPKFVQVPFLASEPEKASAHCQLTWSRSQTETQSETQAWEWSVIGWHLHSILCYSPRQLVLTWVLSNRLKTRSRVLISGSQERGTSCQRTEHLPNKLRRFWLFSSVTYTRKSLGCFIRLTSLLINSDFGTKASCVVFLSQWTKGGHRMATPTGIWQPSGEKALCMGKQIFPRQETWRSPRHGFLCFQHESSRSWQEGKRATNVPPRIRRTPGSSCCPRHCICVHVLQFSTNQPERQGNLYRRPWNLAQCVFSKKIPHPEEQRWNKKTFPTNSYWPRKPLLSLALQFSSQKINQRDKVPDAEKTKMSDRSIYVPRRTRSGRGSPCCRRRSRTWRRVPPSCARRRAVRGCAVHRSGPPGASSRTGQSWRCPRSQTGNWKQRKRYAMRANGTCWCEWEYSHCTQATSKEKRSNLRARRVPRPVWIGPGFCHTGCEQQQVPWICLRLRRVWIGPNLTCSVSVLLDFSHKSIPRKKIENNPRQLEAEKKVEYNLLVRVMLDLPHMSMQSWKAHWKSTTYKAKSREEAEISKTKTFSSFSLRTNRCGLHVRTHHLQEFSRRCSPFSSNRPKYFSVIACGAESCCEMCRQSLFSDWQKVCTIIARGRCLELVWLDILWRFQEKEKEVGQICGPRHTGSCRKGSVGSHILCGFSLPLLGHQMLNKDAPNDSRA